MFYLMLSQADWELDQGTKQGLQNLFDGPRSIVWIVIGIFFLLQTLLFVAGGISNYFRDQEQDREREEEELKRKAEYVPMMSKQRKRKLDRKKKREEVKKNKRKKYPKKTYPKELPPRSVDLDE